MDVTLINRSPSSAVIIAWFDTPGRNSSRSIYRRYFRNIASNTSKRNSNDDIINDATLKAARDKIA